MSTTSVAQFSGPQEEVTALSWDEDGDPGPYQQDELDQYKSTCGDDPNEYLIREHVGNSDEFNPDDSDGHRWVCADRPTDCAFDGRIYSQGQAVDLGSANEESGNAISEAEVCLDDDSSLPGGEWYDLDDDRLTVDNLDSDQVGKLTRVHPDRPTLDRLWDSNPGTDRPRAPTGYATEDDCDEDLQACDDNGDGLSSDPWFSAGAFAEGSRQDNNLDSNSYGGLHNRLQESSNQFEPSAETIDSLRDSYSGTPWTNNQLDTTPGPDNWGLSDTLTDSISNRGESLSRGQCRYRNPGADKRETLEDPSVDKTQKYFGNSYANVQGGRGAWRDPDDISSDETAFSCDLTRDRGIGYDRPTYDRYRESGKVYVGNITFQGGDADDESATGLEHPVCGDDESEYLIETVGSPRLSKPGDGQYACTNTTDFCVNPTSNGPQLFKTNEYKNVGEPREQEGRYKQDSEICLNPDSGRTGDTLHGVWYDQDFNENACRTNSLYGRPGVRWFDKSYVEDYPNAVTGGIDDDYNGFLDSRGLTLRNSNADIDNSGDDPEFPDGSSPVESGTNRSELVTLGFCGGDDGSEYLASQVCRTDVCVSDRSHLGVSKEPESCVYDGSDGMYEDEGVPQPVDEDKHNRGIYNSGEKITLNYQQQKTITCADGQWFREGPVTFDRNKKNVALGGETVASLRVINLGTLETQYRVTLEQDTRAEKFSTIQGEASNTFTVDVSPKESRQFTLDIEGVRDDLADDEDDITVTAEATNAQIQGRDNLEIQVVEPGNAEDRRQDEQDRNIPGITAIEVLVLMLVSMALYARI